MNQTYSKVLQLYPTAKGSQLSFLLWGKEEVCKAQMLFPNDAETQYTQSLYVQIIPMNSSQLPWNRGALGPVH